MKRPPWSCCRHLEAVHWKDKVVKWGIWAFAGDILFSYLYLLQVRRCDSCLANGPLKAQPGAFGHGVTRIGQWARRTWRDESGTISLHALEITG